MIILYEENQTKFGSVGIGVINDAISCVVTEKLNDEYYLEMKYPVFGSFRNELKQGRILYCKPNPYSSEQAFRIYSVTKSIKDEMVIKATHLSYDMNDVPIDAIDSVGIQDAILKIQNGSMFDNPFKIVSDIYSAKTFKTTQPYNLRAILMGDEDESLIGIYDAEIEFNNYYAKITSRRGMNRGSSVRYGKNMTDISHEVTSEPLYNGIIPYYHSEETSTETSSKEEFTKAYVVGSSPYQEDWLSFEKNGTAYHPLDETPVQIESEGDYYGKVYSWDTNKLQYTERIYNEQVIVIQGMLQPNWLKVDFSKFPKIICRAGRRGYFKQATDSDWGEIKGVGDVVFEGILSLSTITENMILYYSEVIPSASSKSNTEVTNIIDVRLDDPIIWLDTPDTKKMKRNKILLLDLSNEFDEEPTKDILKTKAMEYINKNKIGYKGISTDLWFTDLSSLEGESGNRIELGDTVTVIYDDVDISVELRAISTEFDVLKNEYERIELGKKKNEMSSSTIQNGDSIKSLSNDAGYTTQEVVDKIIAKTITADYIEALDAKLTKAQIDQLSATKIYCPGIIEASQGVIDKLVATLLIADNAEIKEMLTAGKISVAGDITVNSGSIKIENSDHGTSFLVDNEGNLYANSATIEGNITANSGKIAGFTITDTSLYTSDYGVGEDDSFFISPTGFSGTISEHDIDDLALTLGSNFGVTRDGVVYAGDIIARGFFGGTANVDSGYIGDTRLLEAESKHFGSKHPIVDPSKNVGHTIVFGIAAINSKSDTKNLDDFLYSVDTDKMVIERDSETEKLVPIYGSNILNSDVNSLDMAYQVIGEFVENETDESIVLYDEPKYYIVSKQYGTWMDLKESGVYNEYTNTALKLKKYLNKEFESSLFDKNVVRYDIITDPRSKKDYIKIKFRL